VLLPTYGGGQSKVQVQGINSKNNGPYVAKSNNILAKVRPRARKRERDLTRHIKWVQNVSREQTSFAREANLR